MIAELLILFLLTWQPMEADSFIIYRDGLRVGRAIDTFYADNSPYDRRVYYYVTAWERGRESDPSGVVTGLKLDWTMGANLVTRRISYKPGSGERVLLCIFLPSGPWLCAWRYFEGVSETVLERPVGERLRFRRGKEATSPASRTSQTSLSDHVYCACEFDSNDNGIVDLSDLGFWAKWLKRDLSLFAQFSGMYGKKSRLVYP